MHQLYNTLSDVYEMMYLSFIDYDEEFHFYNKKLLVGNCRSVAEIGCGTGTLAEKFIKNHWQYTGLDLSSEMLKKAKDRNTGGNFLQADMRDFILTQPVDACIITGRTISYMVTNEDVAKLFQSVNRNLSPGGIVCFDFIDARKFVPAVQNSRWFTHHAKYKNRQFKRECNFVLTNEQSWTMNWQAVYYEEAQHSNFLEIGRDDSLIRAFTSDDIFLFLQLAGFEIMEITERPSYFFDTMICTAKKSDTKIS